MRTFLPYLATAVVLIILSGCEILFLKALHPSWWKKKAVRFLSYGYPLFGAACMVLWGVAMRLHNTDLVRLGGYVTAAVLILGMALMLSLPISGGILFIRKKRIASHPESTGRRSFLRAASLGFPMAAIGTGCAGFVEAQDALHTPRVVIRLVRLPRELHGLRIAHISDLHVGYSISLESVEQVAEAAAGLRPHLVVLTGDLCDITDQYEDCLRILGSIPAPLGIYASIGNHEYFRGIDAILRAYDRGPIPLLRSTGITLTHQGSQIHLAGADDPKTMRRHSREFFKSTIDAAMSSAPSSAFPILLSHRPQGFDYAAERGIPLTLSGHTHGGQLGLGGRSIFEPAWPDQYLWGLYRKGESVLYTTAGAGHWFPYRLGCAREVPLIVTMGEEASKGDVKAMRDS